MAYPIFDGTMVDMTWCEVEAEGKKKAVVLLPIAIIEQHGPHMDLAPDVYLALQASKDVKRKLTDKGIHAVIAPPMYWGLCPSDPFAGTFSISPETMQSLLIDIAVCLKKWGFKQIFAINVHGDDTHIKTILSSMLKVRKQLNIDSRLLLDNWVCKHYGLEENEQSVLAFDDSYKNATDYVWSEYAEIHAGAEETSSMLKDYPNSVKKEMLSGLTDTALNWSQIEELVSSEEKHLKYAPNGYVGNPANTNIEEVAKLDDAMADCMAQSIFIHLKKVN